MVLQKLQGSLKQVHCLICDLNLLKEPDILHSSGIKDRSCGKWQLIVSRSYLTLCSLSYLSKVLLVLRDFSIVAVYFNNFFHNVKITVLIYDLTVSGFTKLWMLHTRVTVAELQIYYNAENQIFPWSIWIIRYSSFFHNSLIWPRKIRNVFYSM